MARIIGTWGSITLLLSAVSCMSESTGPAVDRGPEVPQLAVEPAAARLPAGAGLQLHIVMTGVDATPSGSTGVDTQWMSSDDAVVTVSSSGLIQARGMGVATVTAMVTAPCGTHVAYVGVQVVSVDGSPSSGSAGTPVH